MGMERKQENQDTITTTKAPNNNNNKLSIKVPPSFFRCPISLDVMKSPVSLCTGVTYDRSSIQRWLDSGNNTCPATMQPLPSTDLTPNLTLHRLINLWGWGGAQQPQQSQPLPSKVILEDIRSSPDPIPALNSLLDIISSTGDCDGDDFDNSTLIGPGGAAALLALKLGDQTNPDLRNLRVAESLVAIISKILTQEEPCRQPMLSALAADLDATVSSLISVLKDGGSSFRSRRDAAAVLGAVVGSVDGESKARLAERPDLVPELVRLASREPLDRAAVEAALSCLVGLSGARRGARLRMVRMGIVPLATRVLTAAEKAVGPAAAEKALKLLEVASGCSDGREEICELGERCIGAVLGRMMKAGKEGRESAVAVLWSVCHLFRDRRAQEAVAASNGGLTKILLLMQSDCSAAVRQMTGDLLKIFRVNSKSCLSGYDTKTTHIMPF
ncbi:putative U-box domain-containing protein 29 [Iris pallida]|uniref:U-box domain-containing protein n=1 Tax=Iris pallida TaxID=29817 RepID=A0AAX6H0P6_IRIPA|nr:putative U-box domain-containing protein 29 [Iris pallida]